MANLWDTMFQGQGAAPPAPAAAGQQPGIQIGGDRYRDARVMHREWVLSDPERNTLSFEQWMQQQAQPQDAQAAPVGTPGPATPPSMLRPTTGPLEHPTSYRPFQSPGPSLDEPVIGGGGKYR